MRVQQAARSHPQVERTVPQVERRYGQSRRCDTDLADLAHRHFGQEAPAVIDITGKGRHATSNIQ